ncbi:hypothetical protein P4603_21480 [Priestia aryabhattai]|uniref:hypothetical protein n=1 Tax=Priestia aryabhattai TaxID=412384 RepID=UPI002E224315|nr:hypothetical protein [Priestia aryabhattai]
MKKIDAVMKVFKVDNDFFDLFEDLFDEGLTSIYETFVCLEEVKRCAYVLLDPNVFASNLSDNLQDVFEDEEEYNEFVHHILANQPDMNEEMDENDILELCINLADVESERYNIYSKWDDMGVTFKIADTNLIIDLIGELLGQDVSVTLYNYASFQISDDELRQDLKAKLSETA